MPHQIHLQHHLLTRIAYTIIAKHKQIGWANNKIIIYTSTYIYHKPTKGNLSFDSITHSKCPKTTKLVSLLLRRAIYWTQSVHATMCTLTPATLANPSHKSRDAIPSHNSRNTTCLTPIPSHNSRDRFWATTQGTPAS